MTQQQNTISPALTASRKLTVLSPAQSAHVDLANTFHHACNKTFQDHIVYAFLTGAELSALKVNLEHGQWMQFREAYFPLIPHRTATEYMQFHAKLAPGANLPTVGVPSLLTDGQEPKPEVKEKIFEAARQQEGKTFTQLCRALGIRDTKPKEHHPIKELTPDEKIAAEDAQANALVSELLQAAAVLQVDLSGKDSKCLTRIEPARWKEVSRALVQLNKTLKPLTKRKPSNTKPAKERTKK